jgi:uncharacterized membrane protein YheB (UPF0754 family)
MLLAAIFSNKIFGYAIILLTGTFIGWITNFLAIKMLFHPRKPVNLIFFSYQGIFPKNKMKIAVNLGNVVQNELISFDDIKERLLQADSMQRINDEIGNFVEAFISEKLDELRIAKALIPPGVVQNVQKNLIKDIQNAIPGVIDKYVASLQQNVSIYEMVKEKVENFSDERLEDLILAITNKEFKFIEVVGAVLGFLIACMQIVIWNFI